MGASSHETFRFSTNAVAPADRLSIWREVIGRQYMSLDVEPDPAYPMLGILEMHRWPFLNVAFLRVSPTRFTRTAEQARNGDGDFTLLCSRGKLLLEARDQTAEFAPGDGLLAFNGRDGGGTVGVANGVQTRSVRIDGRLLRAAARDLDQQPIQHLRTDDPSWRLAQAYLDSVLRVGISTPEAGQLVQGHLADLLALAIGPNEQTTERAAAGALPAARFTAIRAHVMDNLSDPHLSARTVAARHGISARYVHLLFERHGLTFHGFVTEERLKRCFRMLVHPAVPWIKISDIAYGAGFGDLSAFNRAFRRRFGDTPSGVRNETLRKRSE